MRSLFALCILLLLISCNRGSKEKYSRYSSFETSESIYAEDIELDTILFRYPFRISVHENIAVVLDLHHVDHFLHAFSYPEWKHLVSFGRRGQAPEEMLSAETIRVSSSDSIWTLDANKMEITRWSIDIIQKTATREEAIPLDKQLIRTLDFCLTDSGFIVPDYTGEYRYSCIDPAGSLLQSYEPIPTEESYADIARPALAQAWRSFIDYLPGKQLLVMATQLGEVLEIYNLEKGTKKVLYGPNGEPKFQIHAGEGIPTGIMGFSDVKITEKYIFAVFHGRSFKEIAQMYDRGENPEDGGRYLCVFDHEGIPIRKYMLDHAIYGISIDESQGTIIATDVNRDDPIIAYKIPL
ncbi:BF3164 family lipoprotein [Massilibacteroides vaginae]|uniref:BF3164 family lipoprotein n=1 Tax=Massilibacteroides vaginae TaxID=1673718 RepID=UPI000A1C9301|nr:BF3164 family lipoprotein [Massilibacteroides vaginae]